LGIQDQGLAALLTERERDLGIDRHQLTSLSLSRRGGTPSRASETLWSSPARARKAGRGPERPRRPSPGGRPRRGRPTGRECRRSGHRPRSTGSGGTNPEARRLGVPGGSRGGFLGGMAYFGRA